jgi:hypothetical protein
VKEVRCIRRICLPLLIPALLVVAPATVDGGKCRTVKCEKRVQTRDFAERYGGCRTARCVQRVRHRNSPRELGRRMARHRNVPWHCVDGIISRESGWNHLAVNRSSGAYGLPQSLPGAKMASVAPDWRTNPRTQLRWFFRYVKARYGGACQALAHWHQAHWY